MDIETFQESVVSGDIVEGGDTIHDVCLKEISNQGLVGRKAVPDLAIDGKWFKLEPNLKDDQPRYLPSDEEPVIVGYKGSMLKMKDQKTGRTVVIKRASESYENILNEARILAKFQHPNVVAVYDLAMSRNRGDLYLVTEWLEGKDLEEVIKHTPPAFKDLPSIINQMASGITHINKQGFVHGDIKSAHFLLTESGETKVIDLGIAQSVDANGTVKWETNGTQGYSPPEQYQGIFSFRGDVFAFGATVYELITGQYFGADYSFSDLKNLKKDPGDFLKLHADYYLALQGQGNLEAEKQLSGIVRQALSYHPDDRQPNVAVFNHQLQKVFASFIS